ncbi:MAG: hypothetical protein V7K89_15540 [Nostoc sp.]|uniref:hypothetical protein n=1 Tax=Nostoc sp. TaxID=1180 RepID=UPI002FF9BCD8
MNINWLGMLHINYLNIILYKAPEKFTVTTSGCNSPQALFLRNKTATLIIN